MNAWQEFIGPIIVVAIASYPAYISAKNSKKAANASIEAKDNAVEAKENSAKALFEVQTNGGMGDPHPNLNDHVKYQTEMTEYLVDAVKNINTSFKEFRREFDEHKEDFKSHLTQSQMMDQAVAELYLEVRPAEKPWLKDD